MIKQIFNVLKYRIILITLLFGAFGGALSLLLKIEDLKNYYPSLATLIALIVSLLISLLIKGKRDRLRKSRLKIAAAILFVLFLICAALHTSYIITRTFEYSEFDEKNRYVKGDYSSAAIEIKKKYPMLTDEQLLYQKMGGTDGIEIFWVKSTIEQNIFLLILTYCGLVMFFVACITLLTEALAEDEPRPKARPKKELPVTPAI